MDFTDYNCEFFTQSHLSRELNSAFWTWLDLVVPPSRNDLWKFLQVSPARKLLNKTRRALCQVLLANATSSSQRAKHHYIVQEVKRPSGHWLRTCLTFWYDDDSSEDNMMIHRMTRTSIKVLLASAQCQFLPLPAWSHQEAIYHSLPTNPNTSIHNIRLLSGIIRLHLYMNHFSLNTMLFHNPSVHTIPMYVPLKIIIIIQHQTSSWRSFKPLDRVAKCHGYGRYIHVKIGRLG